MIRSIQENLTRQICALELLSSLLEEEFSDLMERRPHNVSALELSIQELMRQIAQERASLRGFIGAMAPGKSRVRDILESLSADEAQALSEQLAKMDRSEQICAIQADKNRQLVIGLYDQSLHILKRLHSALEPGKSDLYSRRGVYAKAVQSQANVFRGRL